MYALFKDSFSLNTQPPEGGCFSFGIWASYRSLFQHTAARRRLEISPDTAWEAYQFQHTAARRRLKCRSFVFKKISSFNTQPPEGGCNQTDAKITSLQSFNTQPPEGG